MAVALGSAIALVGGLAACGSSSGDGTAELKVSGSAPPVIGYCAVSGEFDAGVWTLDLWVSQRSKVQIHAPADSKFSGVTHDVS